MTRDSPDFGAATEPPIDAAVIVALGSNLAAAGHAPTQTLEAALARLSAQGLVLVKRSRWWRSRAWPDPAQPDFTNGAAWFITDRPPHAVLDQLQAAEAAFGRRRGAQNDARTLDLDLVAHGRLQLEDVRLTLPHPRAADRAFVMGPICDLDPRWRDPVSGRYASALYSRARIGGDATPVWTSANTLRRAAAALIVSG